MNKRIGEDYSLNPERIIPPHAPTPDLLTEDFDLDKWFEFFFNLNHRKPDLAEKNAIKFLLENRTKLQQARPTTEQTKKDLIEWITDYKDVAERNALAETPEESADYLLSTLLHFPDEQAIRADERNKIGEKLNNIVTNPSIFTTDHSKLMAIEDLIVSLQSGQMPEASEQPGGKK